VAASQTAMLAQNCGDPHGFSNIFRQWPCWDTPGQMRKKHGKTTRLEENRNMRVSHEIEFSSNAKSFHAIL
jgi:hypothetical protein